MVCKNKFLRLLQIIKSMIGHIQRVKKTEEDAKIVLRFAIQYDRILIACAFLCQVSGIKRVVGRQGEHMLECGRVSSKEEFVDLW